jgi:hypothetical protein
MVEGSILTGFGVAGITRTLEVHDPLMWALIFHALRTRYTPGKKVRIAAIPATVNFPALAAGGPTSFLQQLW